MLSMQNVAERISAAIKENGIKKGDFLQKCGLGVNWLSQTAKGKDISCSTIVTIADELGRSVDYLLCRTDADGRIEGGDGLQLADDENDLLEFFRGMSRSNQHEIYVAAKRMYETERGTGTQISN